MTAEKYVSNVFGTSCKNLKLNLINVNSNPTEGNTEKGQNVVTFIENMAAFFPNIVKNYNDDMKQHKPEEKMEVAERFFVPFWFSPTSSKNRQHPIDFGGDHNSESLYKDIDTLATHQMFAILWNNTHLCAALASKKKYDSLGTVSPKLLIPEEGYSSKEVEYAIERGVCNTVGLQTTESCRWIGIHQAADKKYNATMICGDNTFLSGSCQIFKTLFDHIDIIKTRQNNKFNGIKLADVSINSTNIDDKVKQSSLVIARLLGGSIFLHDYLCVLRDIFNVKKLVEIDTTIKNEQKVVSIDIVINDFAKVKKYVSIAKALKTIR